MKLFNILLKTAYSHFFFLVIFVLAFFLRAQEFLSNNYLFLIDQGRDMMDVGNIVFNHKLTLIGPYTSLGGVFQGPLYYYLLAIPTAILNGDPIGTLFTMVLISLSTIIFIYLSVSKLFGKTQAIFASFLFAISPEAAAAATYVWNPHPMWFLVTLYAVFLYLGIYRKPKCQLVLFPTIFLMFHFQTALGVFLLIATLFYIVIFKRKALNKKYLSYSFLIGLIFLLPQVLFELRHDFLMTKSVVEIFTGGSNKGLFVGGESQGYSSLINSHIKEFIQNFKSSVPHTGYFTHLPAVLIVFLILRFTYLKKFFSKEESRITNLLLIIVGIVVALSFIYPFPIRYWFLTGFQSFYLIIFGIILGVSYRAGKLTKTLSIIFIAAGLIYFVLRIQTIYLFPPNEGGLAKIKGKVGAVEYIYNDAKDTKFGLLIFTPYVLTDPYDYIILWRFSPKYGYTPHKDKDGIVYLLIEPDPQQPWSYKGWLETVIIDGKVLETVELPSGFIIQKREFSGNN